MFPPCLASSVPAVGPRLFVIFCPFNQMLTLVSSKRTSIAGSLVASPGPQLAKLCNDGVQWGTAGLGPDRNLTGFGALDFFLQPADFQFRSPQHMLGLYAALEPQDQVIERVGNLPQNMIFSQRSAGLIIAIGNF